MTYGHLTLITGPMMAGKTTRLLAEIAAGEDRRAIFKPSFDDRYSEHEIVTHDGERIWSVSLNDAGRMFEIAENAEIIFLDEVQFFSSDRLIVSPALYPNGLADIVREWLVLGKDVVANGLDLDVHGHPWPVTAHLAAMADTVIKLTARCSVCDRPATKTARLDDPAEIFSPDNPDLHIELGSADKYEPRCNAHWRQ